MPVPHTDEAINEARRIVKETPLQGIALNTLIRDKISLVDERFIPLFQELNVLEARVYIHATGCGANSPMLNDFADWLKEQLLLGAILPKSLLGKAVDYSLKRWRLNCLSI